MRGALLYAGRPAGRGPPDGAGPVAGPASARPWSPGLAALALYGFTLRAPRRSRCTAIDVLVPRTRRLRSTRFVQVTRAAVLPRPQRRLGVPLAPVERALADAVASLADASTVRRLLTEAVRGGHCEPASVVRELNEAKLLGRAHVVDAVDALLVEGRAMAEGRLYEMVRTHGLPRAAVERRAVACRAAASWAGWTRTGRSRRSRSNWAPAHPGRSTSRSPPSGSTWSGSG